MTPAAIHRRHPLNACFGASMQGFRATRVMMRTVTFSSDSPDNLLPLKSGNAVIFFTKAVSYSFLHFYFHGHSKTSLSFIVGRCRPLSLSLGAGMLSQKVFLGGRKGSLRLPKSVHTSGLIRTGEANYCTVRGMLSLMLFSDTLNLDIVQGMFDFFSRRHCILRWINFHENRAYCILHMIWSVLYLSHNSYRRLTILIDF